MPFKSAMFHANTTQRNGNEDISVTPEDAVGVFINEWMPHLLFLIQF